MSTEPFDYLLVSMEFEAKRLAKADPSVKYWTGKVCSNKVKITADELRAGGAPEAASGLGEPVRGLAVSLKVTPGEWQEGQIGTVSMEVVLKNTTDKKMLVYRNLGRDADPSLLRIQDEAGRVWAYGRHEQVLLGDPGPNDFMELAPGQEKVVRMKLKPDEYYFALPPGGKRPIAKTEVGNPSFDDRVPELPAGNYTLTYTHQAVILRVGRILRTGRNDEEPEPTLDKFRAVAKELGYDDFWTGEASSKPVKVRVTGTPPARPPQPKGEVF